MPLLTVADYVRLPYIEPDHRYAYGDAPLQFAELYLPASAPPHPLILLVHGGCYSGEYDLKPLSALARRLTAEGFAVWNIEYRSAGTGGDFPNMFLDVAAAADALRDIAAAHSLDLETVIAAGHSAGGHLALWLAARAQLAASSPLYRAEPLSIAAVLGLAPIADIEDALRRGMCGAALSAVMGDTPEAHLPAASPRVLLPPNNPQTLIVGAEDRLVLANVQRYVEAAAKSNAAVELMTLAGAGHFEIVAVDAPAMQAVLAALRDLYGRAQADVSEST